MSKNTIGTLHKFFTVSLYNLPTPPNLTIWWNFGSCLGLVLILQLVSGLFLSLHYTCDGSLSFSSISHIIRDVCCGWLIRFLHANGASFFFLALYCHIGRGLYFGSYTFNATWAIGVCLLLLVMASAFLGYVLPWGQISFWGATVITNLFSALPYCGGSLVGWLWGGFAVDTPTLTRFYSFHFLIPFVLSGLAFLHIFYLHGTGSNNPLGVTSHSDKLVFHSLYWYNDLFGFSVFVSALLLVVFLCPQLWIEADNFIPANPIVTPSHIVPEWYFLFAYAILRSVPSKLGGVFAMLSSILILFLLPFLHTQNINGLSFYGPVNLYFWTHFTVFVLLSLGGSWPVEVPFVSLSRLLSTLYFLFYIILSLLRHFWDEILS